MKKLVEKVGWTWKNESPIIVEKKDPFDNKELEIIGVYSEKGKYDSWQDHDWPPRKVRVIIALE